MHEIYSHQYPAKNLSGTLKICSYVRLYYRLGQNAVSGMMMMTPVLFWSLEARANTRCTSKNKCILLLVLGPKLCELGEHVTAFSCSTIRILTTSTLHYKNKPPILNYSTHSVSAYFWADESVHSLFLCNIWKSTTVLLWAQLLLIT